MSHSLPIVCTKIPENNEIARSGVECLQFKKKDHNTQSKLIIEVLEGKHKNLGKNAKKRVIENYNDKSQLKKTMKLYEELVCEKK